MRNLQTYQVSLFQKNQVQIDKMVEELRRLVIRRASAVDGLLGVVISDKDGVPILKASVDQTAVVVDNCFRHQFLSISNTITEQAAKMVLGTTNHILAAFDQYQV